MMGGALTNVVPAYGILIGLDQRAAILLTAAVQIGALVTQWPMSLLADRIASRIILLAAISIVVLTSGVLAILIHLGQLGDRLALFALFGAIGGCSISLYTVAVAHAFFRLGRDHAVGLSARLLFLWGVGSTIGPVTATLFMQVLGPQGLVAYIMLLSLLVAAYLALRITQNPSPTLVDGGVSPPTMPDIELGKR